MATTTTYEVPATLEKDYLKNEESRPDKLRNELNDAVNQILQKAGNGYTAVQCKISGYKSFVAILAAEKIWREFEKPSFLLVPQRQNKEHVLTRAAETFSAPVVEHPSRIDCCTWSKARNQFDFLDSKTCNAIACPKIRDKDIAKNSVKTVKHGKWSAEEYRGRGNRSDICGYEIYRAIRETRSNRAINIATYQKALKDREFREETPKCHALFLDEAHIVASIDGGQSDEELQKIRTWLLQTQNALENLSLEQWAADLIPQWSELKIGLEQWVRDTKLGQEQQLTEINQYVEGGTGEALDTVKQTSNKLVGKASEEAARGNWETVHEHIDVLRTLSKVDWFVKNVEGFSNGNRDIVNVPRRQSKVKASYFRKTTGEELENEEPPETPGWVDKRFSTQLNDRLQKIAEQREILSSAPNGRRPKRTLEEIEEILKPEITVAFSATHNALSKRSWRNKEETEHKLRHRAIALPVEARATEKTFGGRNWYEEGPARITDKWFSGLINKFNGLGNVAAVPANFRNEEIWEKYVEETVVPNSEGALGSKDFEKLEIDVVMAELQIQQPDETAQRLLEWWDRIEDVENREQTLWRLLAQFTVAPTIQAAGRFKWKAPTAVLDDGEIFRKALYSIETAEPGDKLDPRYSLDNGELVDDRKSIQMVNWFLQQINELGKSKEKREKKSAVLRTLRNTQSKGKLIKEATEEYLFLDRNDVEWVLESLEENGKIEKWVGRDGETTYGFKTK